MRSFSQRRADWVRECKRLRVRVWKIASIIEVGLGGRSLPGTGLAIRYARRSGIEPVRLEKSEVRVRGIRAAEHHDPPVVVKWHPVRALHQPLIGRRRLADPGFDHDRADLVFVEQRLPFLDVVVAQGLARLFPLHEQFGREETRPAVDVRLDSGRTLPDQGVALGHRRVEDVPLDLLVVRQKFGRLERESVRVVTQPELDLVERVFPPGDVDADHEEDERERDQSATRRPDRPRPSQPAFGPELVVVPLLAVGPDDRGEDHREHRVGIT